MEEKKITIECKFHYFDYSEFDQPGLPGSGKEFMDTRLLMILDNMRHRSKFSYKITSGYRSPEYNSTLKNSSPDSSHCKGKAADIYAANSLQKFSIIEAALHFGIERIGVGANFVHIDIDDKEKPAKVCWTY